MEIKEITGKQCKTARSLWEEVFYEDSKQFTDYYFEHKAEKNIGYVIGEAPYEAMMFRTPYQLQVEKEQREITNMTENYQQQIERLDLRIPDNLEHIINQLNRLNDNSEPIVDNDELEE